MTELARPQSGSASVVTGEVVSSDGLAVTASEVAARQRSPETRRTYAAVYRTFCAFLGPDANADAVTPHRAAVPHGGRAGLQHEDGPRGHRQRHEQTAVVDRSRYQRADAPVDERWVTGPDGEPPVGHGTGAKRGKIC